MRNGVGTTGGKRTSQWSRLTRSGATGSGSRPARGGWVLKSPREIELMRQAGAVVHRVLTEMKSLAKPGVATRQLNDRAEELIAESGGTALFKGQRNPTGGSPFPAALCISINEQIVHGIPGDRVLREGDVASIDCGVRLNGYCGDSAVTLGIGELEPKVQRLLDVTRGALELAIREIAPGRQWSEIARQMQGFVEEQGFSVVRNYVGHGIGAQMHEDPKIPNYWDRNCRNDDFRLEPGMVLAIEPMVNVGTHRTRAAADGWTVTTEDGEYSAHFEHSIAVTRNGPDVLTDGRTCIQRTADRMPHRESEDGHEGTG